MSHRPVLTSLSAAELAERRSVWAALCWTYLDTEPSDSERRAQISVLAGSDFSMSQLKRIDRTEVCPAMWGQAFYGRWIEVYPDPEDPSIHAIERRLSQGRFGRTLRALPGGPIRWYMRRDGWRVIGPAIADARRSSAA